MDNLSDKTDEEIVDISPVSVTGSSNVQPIAEMLRRSKDSIDGLTNAIENYSQTADRTNKRLLFLTWILVAIGIFEFAPLAIDAIIGWIY